jgi:putative endonuclease
MPHTYILECSDGTFYVGSTWDLERRVGEHNLGLGAEYTKRRLPVRLIWATEYDRIEDAYRFEKKVQGWGRAKRLALIEGRWNDLPVLARTAQPPETEPGSRQARPPEGDEARSAWGLWSRQARPTCGDLDRRTGTRPDRRGVCGLDRLDRRTLVTRG